MTDVLDGFYVGDDEEHCVVSGKLIKLTSPDGSASQKILRLRVRGMRTTHVDLTADQVRSLYTCLSDTLDEMGCSP